MYIEIIMEGPAHRHSRERLLRLDLAAPIANGAGRHRQGELRGPKRGIALRQSRHGGTEAGDQCESVRPHLLIPGSRMRIPKGSRMR
jgi:hypothetical protein